MRKLNKIEIEKAKRIGNYWEWEKTNIRRIYFDCKVEDGKIWFDYKTGCIESKNLTEAEHKEAALEIINTIDNFKEPAETYLIVKGAYDKEDKTAIPERQLEYYKERVTVLLKKPSLKIIDKITVTGVNAVASHLSLSFVILLAHENGETDLLKVGAKYIRSEKIKEAKKLINSAVEAKGGGEIPVHVEAVIEGMERNDDWYYWIKQLNTSPDKLMREQHNRNMKERAAG